MKYLLYILPGFCMVLYARYKSHQLVRDLKKQQKTPVAVPEVNQFDEVTVRIRHIPDVDLIKLDPEGVFTKGE